jgi:hypothetical protein
MLTPMTTNDLYDTCPVKREPTEDGDLLITWEVTAKGRKGAEAFCKDSYRYIKSWTGAGNGMIKAQYCVLVDGAEIAIERRNDEWASRQQDIEDHGRASAGWFW